MIEEVLPLWAQIVVGVAGLLVIGCAVFLFYVYRRERKGLPIWTTLSDVQTAADAKAGASASASAFTSASPTEGIEIAKAEDATANA